MATTLQSLIDQTRDRLKAGAALAPPGQPTITNVGTPGATTYSYKVTATNATGESLISSVGQTTTGNATLNSSNYNVISWARVWGATGYKVYKNDSGTYKLLATIGSGTTLLYNDQGAALGAAAPTADTTGVDDQYWSDKELLDILNKGIKDLWRSIVDLEQEHFLTIDSTNVSAVASTTALSGVPNDVYKVHMLRPRTYSSNRGLYFRPKDIKHPDWQAAEAMSAVPATDNTIWYSIINAGAPTGAPTINIAPQLNAACLLTLIYVPVLAEKEASDNNPIPGESDNALICWTVAFARAKEREEAAPDPEWISIYSTEKQNILTSLTPRQVQEPEYVEAMFEAWNEWM